MVERPGSHRRPHASNTLWLLHEDKPTGQLGTGFVQGVRGGLVARRQCQQAGPLEGPVKSDTQH